MTARGIFRLAALVAVALAPATAGAQMAKLQWDAEGYYRTRAVYVSNLAPEPRQEYLGDIVLPDIRNTSYLMHRFRLSPSLSYGTFAKLYLQFDGLDDVVWGDNNGVSTAPLFAVNPSNQGWLGGPEQDTFKLTRAWIEFQVPVGALRIGRMPSHWGMGILANGGGSGNWDPLSPVGEPRRKVADYYFDDDFGDNHFGSTNDRILFATKPLSIMRTIQKKADTSSNFIVAYAYDKLVESPWLIREPDRVTRPFGLVDWTSRGAPQDDVNEHVFVVAYSNADWDQVAFTDELRVGTYQVLRTQDQGFTNPTACIGAAEPCIEDEGSFVWIADFWYKIRYGNWYSEAEYVHISGDTTGGVPYPEANLKKTASIDGLSARLGYLTTLWDVVLEGGYSSGDDNLRDDTLSQRPLHPDYNVGLILYEEVLRERTARAYGPPLAAASPPAGATGFFSNGGVINSWYIHPKIRYRLPDWGLEIIGAALFAFADQFSDYLPSPFATPNDSDSKYLGTEIDLAIKSRFADGKIDISLETGYLIFGDLLKTPSNGSGFTIDDAETSAFSIQARAAFIF